LGIDKIGWEGAPREYDPIEEIDLLDFDFDEYLAKREKASEARRMAWAQQPSAGIQHETR
jgi:hypothetical protein